MYCAACNVDHHDGATHCFDPGVPMGDALRSTSWDRVSALVTVFESDDSAVIAVAKGLLEQAGVPFRVQGDETGPRLLYGPILYPACRFLVSPSREADALAALEPLARPVPQLQRA